MSTLALSLHFDTTTRDTVTYPNANSCRLDINSDIRLSDIKSIKLTNIELPNVGYSVITPTAYFSECIEERWYPFLALGASGNHNASSIVSLLAGGFENDYLYTRDFLTTRHNTYSISYSDDVFGRFYLKSDGVVPYNVHLRKDNVKVLSAIVDADDASRINMTISDSSDYPLLPGAVCELSFPTSSGMSGSVVVQKADTAKTIQVTQATLDEYSTTWAGTWHLTAGETLDLTGSGTSYLVPLSANNNVLANELGFGILKDMQGGGSTDILFVVSPCSDNITDGIFRFDCSTKTPLSVSIGEYVRFADTGYFVDGNDAVIDAVISDNVFSLALTAYGSLFGDEDIGTGRFKVGSGEPYYLNTIALEYTLDNVIVVEVEVAKKDDSGEENLLTDFTVGNNIWFWNMTNWEMVENDFEVLSITGNYTDTVLSSMTIQLKGEYPCNGYTWGTVTLVNEDAGTAEDGSTDRLPCKTASIYHFDTSRNNKVIFMEVLLNGSVSIGSVYTSSIPGKAFFSRIVLAAGVNAMHFLEGVDDVDEVKFSQWVTRVSYIHVNLYGDDGELYSLDGLDFSFNLMCKREPRSINTIGN